MGSLGIHELSELSGHKYIPICPYMVSLGLQWISKVRCTPKSVFGHEPSLGEKNMLSLDLWLQFFFFSSPLGPPHGPHLMTARRSGATTSKTFLNYMFDGVSGLNFGQAQAKKQGQPRKTMGPYLKSY